MLKLNRTDNALNRNTRNNDNDNWAKLEKKYNDVAGEITEEVFNKIVDDSRIYWSQMVDTVADLPRDAKIGETRGVKEDNKIYHFDGSNWIPIAEINLNPIAEVDQRLTQQLAETDRELGEINETLNDKVIATDLQRIDVEALEENEEYQPIVLKNREAEVSTVVRETIDDSHNRRIYIDMKVLRKFKTYDFLIFNESISDVRIAITPAMSSTSTASMDIVMEDGSFSTYGNGSSDVHHLIPAGVRGVILSHVPAINSDGLKAMSKKPYEGLYGGSYLCVQYRQTENSSGENNLSIMLMGVPN